MEKFLADGSFREYVTLQSGIPLALTQITNCAFAGFGTAAPVGSQIPNCRPISAPSQSGSTRRRLQSAPNFTLGTAPQSCAWPCVSQCGFRNNQANVLGEQTNIEFRTEIFNLTTSTARRTERGSGNAAPGTITQREIRG
jgi:hypothetical protein